MIVLNMFDSFKSNNVLNIKLRTDGRDYKDLNQNYLNY